MLTTHLHTIAGVRLRLRYIACLPTCLPALKQSMLLYFYAVILARYLFQTLQYPFTCHFHRFG